MVKTTLIPEIMRPWLALVLALALTPLITNVEASEALQELDRTSKIYQSLCTKRIGINTDVRVQSAGKTSSPARKLFEALATGNVKRVDCLLNRGVDVNVTNDKGMPALVFLFSMAPYRGSLKARLEIARLLISRGADPSAMVPASVNPFGVSVLDWAIFTTRSVDAVFLFLEYGADPNKAKSRPLFSAVAVDKKEIVELLISRGAEVNARDKMGQTPLFLVQSIGVATALIDNGADVNALNDEGTSVLQWVSDPYKACGKGGCDPINDKLVRYLESKGAQ